MYFARGLLLSCLDLVHTTGASCTYFVSMLLVFCMHYVCLMRGRCEDDVHILSARIMYSLCQYIMSSMTDFTIFILYCVISDHNM